MAETRADNFLCETCRDHGMDSEETGQIIQTAAGAKKFSKTCFLKPNGAENFFKRKLFALRSILSIFCPNQRYPRDFLAV